jgi:hypothetical protein
MSAFTEDVNSDIVAHQAPTAGELDEQRRHNLFIPLGDIDPNSYPRMSNMSAGFLFETMIRPLDPEPPEYVAIPMERGALELAGAVGQWNMVWETAQFRRRYFGEDDLPAPLRKIAELGDVNVSIVPRTRTRYFEYAPIAHLLSVATLDRFGLPLLRAGEWPFLADLVTPDRLLPNDFGERLKRAWAATVWPHLVSGSSMRAFSEEDPIRLLSHNLDYWLPAVSRVIQGRLAKFGRVQKGRVSDGSPVRLEDGSLLADAVAVHPLRGGDIWAGEAEAAEVVAATVEAADERGQLRAILDAVRSHRVEDDFSSRWSYAREDFERKLYRKRAKVQVRFVELTDTIPVQGRGSEIDNDLITNDFLALLDRRNREIVILLSSGYSKTEIAKQLGYANHSAVSKRLALIRKQASAYFDEE